MRAHRVLEGRRLRAAVFGGSFNPPHLGHRAICRFLLAHGFDEVWIVPCYRHAFGKRLASFANREALCGLLVQGIEGVRVLDIERRIGGLSRTIRTLRALRREHPGVRMSLVVGSDAMSETSKWLAFEEIRKLAPIVVIPRRGSSNAAGFLSPVSSTDVRQRIHGGLSIDRLVGRRVASYIQEHGLYGASRHRSV